MPVYAKLLGKGVGNFNDKVSSPGEIMKMITGARPGDNWPRKFFVMNYSGSKIVSTRDLKLWQRWGDDFLAVKDGASCVVLGEPYQGAVFFPCGHVMVCLYEIRGKNDKRLAVLIFINLADQRQSSDLISKLFTRHQFSAKAVYVDIGWGDAPCCDKENSQQKLIERLEKFGVIQKRIVVHPPCTSCAGRDTPEISDDFHSFARDGEGVGRNAFVAWFG